MAPTLIRLAGPNVAVMLLQAAVTTLDGVFVGWLGSDALAGISIVFPLVMLMQTMSAGGMGGAVASAIARALGAGRRDDADALVVHALLIAGVMATLFTGCFVLGGPAIYHAMGGRGGALESALAYSNVVFGGALVYWLFNTLGSIVRGAGNMTLPAVVMTAVIACYLTLSPSLLLGWGVFPRLGIRGVAVA
ncbi:MAG TPA: MATE family efflux transporter, partial [Candidatus Methylomirabilis sp.]|nr:MATE family efflux transporter [Candidatus Methylomirabilis sp.]